MCGLNQSDGLLVLWSLCLKIEVLLGHLPCVVAVVYMYYSVYRQSGSRHLVYYKWKPNGNWGSNGIFVGLPSSIAAVTYKRLPHPEQRNQY